MLYPAPTPPAPKAQGAWVRARWGVVFFIPVGELRDQTGKDFDFRDQMGNDFMLTDRMWMNHSFRDHRWMVSPAHQSAV